MKNQFYTLKVIRPNVSTEWFDLNENTKVKSWYTWKYPTDDYGHEISDVTFYDIFRALDNYKCVYATLDVDDSIIRERVFQALADIMKVDYDYIYEQWLKVKY